MNAIEQSSSRKPSAIVVVSAGFWLVSVALGGLTVFALRELLIWTLALVIPMPTIKARLEAADFISLAQQCGVLIFGVIGLGVVVYCTDRFFRYAGQTRLLRLLGRIIVVESVIVLPVWWLFWR